MQKNDMRIKKEFEDFVKTVYFNLILVLKSKH